MSPSIVLSVVQLHDAGHLVRKAEMRREVFQTSGSEETWRVVDTAEMNDPLDYSFGRAVA